jgi:hypothetical protein
LLGRMKRRFDRMNRMYRMEMRREKPIELFF